VNVFETDDHMPFGNDVVANELQTIGGRVDILVQQSRTNSGNAASGHRVVEKHNARQRQSESDDSGSGVEK
jgi:hypothetical protein